MKPRKDFLTDEQVEQEIESEVSVLDKKEKIETVSCELLKICTEKGLSINEMFELSRVFPQKIREQIDLLESNTKFRINFDSNIQG